MGLFWGMCILGWLVWGIHRGWFLGMFERLLIEFDLKIGGKFCCPNPRDEPMRL